MGSPDVFSTDTGFLVLQSMQTLGDWEINIPRGGIHSDMLMRPVVWEWKVWKSRLGSLKKLRRRLMTKKENRDSLKVFIRRVRTTDRIPSSLGWIWPTSSYYLIRAIQDGDLSVRARTSTSTPLPSAEQCKIEWNQSATFSRRNAPLVHVTLCLCTPVPMVSH